MDYYFFRWGRVGARAVSFVPRTSFAPLSTYARVQSGFEFVELIRGMCSECQGQAPGVTGITRWYRVPATIHESTVVYVRENVVCKGTRGSPESYLWIYERSRTLRDVRMAYLGNNMHLLCGDDYLWGLPTACGLQFTLNILRFIIDTFLLLPPPVRTDLPTAIHGLALALVPWQWHMCCWWVVVFYAFVRCRWVFALVVHSLHHD